jgi:carbamoyl-phosphate synthase large subunit
MESMTESSHPTGIRSYRDLEVWQIAMELSVEAYRLSARFPSAERFGLTAQLRRAAISVPANVAEGQARFGQREFRHFVSIARGSVAEVETLIALAARLELAKQSDVEHANALCLRVSQMLARLHQRLRPSG